jgi:hypothetical protein
VARVEEFVLGIIEPGFVKIEAKGEIEGVDKV